MSNAIQVVGKDGVILRAEAFEEGILRIRAGGADGFAESLLERYGIVERLLPAEECAAAGHRLSLACGTELDLDDGMGFSVRHDGQPLVASLPGTRVATAPTVYRNQGCLLEIPIADSERLVGFGDQVRTRFLLNGQKDELWIRYPVKHVPVPFFMSSRGYGVFFNTTRRLRFDVGATQPDVARFHIEKDFLDIFILTGDDFDEILVKYCRLTGFPALPPLKSFGLWLILNTRATGHDVLAVARELRHARIPCDNLSLEPDWMEQRYDYSVNKEWSAEKFRGVPHGSTFRAGPDHMMRALGRMGYSLGLWLCCRHDFTWEEERRIARKESDAAKTEADLEGVEISHLDENMGHGAVWMDTFTPRDQPWFEHLKKFVKDGVRFFKVDPAVLINEFPDRLYGNGRRDEEMHNLAFLLCSKQMNEDFEAFTGKRYFGISVAGWAGQQRYPGTWAGDTGGGKQPLIGILQDAIVGHPYATCDMKTDTIDGIHMGFLLPWSLINSWSYFHYPGYQGETIDGVYRDYASLRMRLLPYLYSLAWRASRTGRAMVRPMFMLHPERAEAYEAEGQFYMGDGLLATVFQPHVRLPEGRWFDFWTHQIVSGDWTRRELPYPPNRGGHLFVAPGALVPMWPLQQYVGEQDVQEITWLAFPGAEGTESRFVLYLDDGDGLGYRDGAFAAVEFVMTSAAGRVDFRWGNVWGNEPERLNRMAFRVELLGAPEPRSAASDEMELDVDRDPESNRAGIGTFAYGRRVSVHLV